MFLLTSLRLHPYPADDLYRPRRTNSCHYRTARERCRCSDLALFHQKFIHPLKIAVPFVKVWNLKIPTLYGSKIEESEPKGRILEFLGGGHRDRWCGICISARGRQRHGRWGHRRRVWSELVVGVRRVDAGTAGRGQFCGVQNPCRIQFMCIKFYI